METVEKKEFTVIWFDYGMYHSNKYGLKKIIHEYGLAWNEGKVKTDLDYEVLVDIYKVFRVENRVVGDKNIEDRSGVSGIWESRENVIKIIMFDKKDENEHLPVLMVYKGEESGFYKEFIRLCVNIGCEISKIVEGENGEYDEIFKRKKNVLLYSMLSDEFSQRQLMIDGFLRRVKELEVVGNMTSKEFISGWKELINKYGTYTDKMLFSETCSELYSETKGSEEKNA